MRKLSSLLLLILSSTSWAQKRAIELRNNFWIGESVVELAYQGEFSDQIGFEVFLGGGNYGTRMYDGKTKNIFGNSFDLIDKYYAVDVGSPYRYYKSAHRGFMFGLGLNLRKEFNNRFQFNFTAGVGLSQTFDNVDQDYKEYPNIVLDTSYSVQHLNISFYYNTTFSYRISKKIYLTIGANLPFYFMITNKHSQPAGDEDLDDLALGFEPKMLIGLKYQLKR